MKDITVSLSKKEIKILDELLYLLVNSFEEVGFTEKESRKLIEIQDKIHKIAIL